MDDRIDTYSTWTCIAEDTVKSVLIIGGGVSGLAAADYFYNKFGCEITVADRAKIALMSPYNLVSDSSWSGDFDFDLVIPSPGIPKEHVLCKLARQKGIKISSEAEIGLGLLKGKKIGITGTNGKSSCVSSICHVLNRCGVKKAFALGNIGNPLISAVDKVCEDDVSVIELSSFQLEDMCQADQWLYSNKLDVSVILNISQDHLDRHGTIANYVQAKKNICRITCEAGTCFIHRRVMEGFHHEFANLYNTVIFDGDIVYEICSMFGVSRDVFVDSMSDFVPLKHRLEFVSSVGGVMCYNDSKSTNPASTSYAVRTLSRNIILIAGGRNKGCSVAEWREAFFGRVMKIILIGESKEQIAKELDVDIEVYFEDTLAGAIQKGLQLANQGDNLLFSPGCSSFDMFSNFEDRGRSFIRGVEDESKRYNFVSGVD